MSARQTRPRAKPVTGAERRQGIRESLADDEEVIFFDGFDDAIIGLTEMQPSRNARLVCYDYDKLVRCCRQMGMDEDEAIEYLEFNTIGAWVGELTPVIVRQLRRDQCTTR